MKSHFFAISLLGLAMFIAQPVQAQLLSENKIPTKILDTFGKKHPTAKEISGETTKHFGQDLVAIYFTEGEKKIDEDKEIDNHFVELYRTNGHFYVSASKVDTSRDTNMMSTTANDSLKAAFKPGYSIKDLVLIANPNGVGEEYDAIIEADGEKWRISIDKKGAITTKERSE
jgi:hypothetical protein